MTAKVFKDAVDAMKAARIEKNWYPFKNHNSGTGGANVLTGFIKEDGKNGCYTYPCHNPIHSFVGADVCWSAWGWRGKEDIAKRYFKWLIHNSPWSGTGIIPNLSDDMMFTEGFVFGDLYNTPANLLHNFLVASRMCAEWPEIITRWNEYVSEHGIEPAFAFLWMTVFMSGTGTFANVDKYDWPLDMARATEDYVRNFVEGKTVGLDTKMFSPTAKTKPVNTLWGDLVGNTSKKAYVRILLELYKDSHGKSTLLKSTLGRVSDDPIYYWSFTQKAQLEICKLEFKRLFGTTDKKEVAA